MVKQLKMIVNGIITVVFNILTMYIVKNASVLSQQTFLNNLLFCFDFIAWIFVRDGCGIATTVSITIIIAPSNNSAVLVTPFISDVFYPAGLKDEILKFFKMVRLNVSVLKITLEYSNVFKLLLVLQVIFIQMIDLIVNIFYIPEQHHQNIQQQKNQVLVATMWYFWLSRNEQFNFSCMIISKLYLQHLQIFKCVTMIVNETFFKIYDILFMYGVIIVFILLRYAGF